MSEPARTELDKPAEAPPVVVKKYANRRLYNTESSSYITLDNLAEMVRQGRDFVVYDAKTGEDITRGVLTQIIVEEEGKGRAMLPTGFLRQLIGFYGGRCKPGAALSRTGDGGASPSSRSRCARRCRRPWARPVPVRQHGGGGPAEHGDDGTGVQPVHAVLSPRRPKGTGKSAGRRGELRTRAGDRRPASRGGEGCAANSPKPPERGTRRTRANLGGKPAPDPALPSDRVRRPAGTSGQKLRIRGACKH